MNIFDKPLTTPVLLMVFNRPETTAKVFEAIRRAKPKQLFIVADGPRENKKEDIEKCQRAKEIATAIDWDCEVKTLFRQKNLGCKLAVSSAIGWFFENVEEGIVLEDDCLPSQSFFWFCQELLRYYREDGRIAMISGNNYLETWKDEIFDYFFHLVGIWGWATWRNRWKHYDVNMTLWKDQDAKKRIKEILNNDKIYRRTKRMYDLVYQGKLDTWDYQWRFARLINRGLTVVPSKNLVSNIGFGPGSTHTTNAKDIYGRIKTYELKFPLRINNSVVIDREYDKLYSSRIVHKFFMSRLFDKIQKRIRRFIFK